MSLTPKGNIYLSILDLVKWPWPKVLCQRQVWNKKLRLWQHFAGCSFSKWEYGIDRALWNTARTNACKLSVHPHLLASKLFCPDLHSSSRHSWGFFQVLIEVFLSKTCHKLSLWDQAEASLPAGRHQPLATWVGDLQSQQLISWACWEVRKGPEHWISWWGWKLGR